MTILFQYPALQEPVFTPVVETISADKWIYPYVDPVRRAYDRAIYTEAYTGPVNKPASIESITLDKWYQDFRQPTLRKFATADYAVANTDPANFSGTPVVPTGWLEATTLPTIPSKLSVAAQGFMESVANANPSEVINEDKWHYDFFNVNYRIPNRALYLDAHTIPDKVIVNETVTVDKWWRNFDPPVLRKYDTARFVPALTISQKPIIAETITVDKWFMNFQQPITPRVNALINAASPDAVMEVRPLPNPNITGYLPIMGVG
jgi:hypothetical protein